MLAGVGRLSETFDLYPPKAEATGSNPVGRANMFNGLAVAERFAAVTLSALPGSMPVLARRSTRKSWSESLGLSRAYF